MVATYFGGLQRHPATTPEPLCSQGFRHCYNLSDGHELFCHPWLSQSCYVPVLAGCRSVSDRCLWIALALQRHCSRGSLTGACCQELIPRACRRGAIITQQADAFRLHALFQACHILVFTGLLGQITATTPR